MMKKYLCQNYKGELERLGEKLWEREKEERNGYVKSLRLLWRGEREKGKGPRRKIMVWGNSSNPC